MPSNEDSQGQGSSNRPKKRRATMACDWCSRRKVKCDISSAANGVCSNCATMEIECKQTQRKKRGPKLGTRRRPSSEVKYLVYSILSAPQIFTPPDDSQAVHAMIVDIATYARDLETELNRLRPLSISTTHTTSKASITSPPNSVPITTYRADAAGDDREAHLLASHIHALTLEDNTRAPRPIGQLTLLRTVFDIRAELNGGERGAIALQHRRPEFWTKAPWHHFIEPEYPSYVFPEDGLMKDLVDLYFGRHHFFYPLLHRPTFERQVFIEKLHLTNKSFAATLLAVCSLSARFSSDPRNLFDGTNSERSIGWKYFRQIRLPGSMFVSPPSLFDIQLCALSAWFLIPTPNADGAWAVSGLGIRLAQSVGAHKKQPLGESHDEIIERELWKRAYWALVVFDLLQCLSMGRPRATTEDDFDLEYPAECDDVYWTKDDQVPDAAFIQPSDKPSYMAYWTHHLKLMSIAGYAHRSFDSARRCEPWVDATPVSNHKISTELNTMLDDWLDATPEHLRYDPQNPDRIFFRQSMVLRMSFYWIQMHIHKSFIRPGPVSTMNFSSLAMCATAAKSYIHLVETYHQRPGFTMTHHTIPPLFMSAVLLLVNVWKRTWMNSVLDQKKELAEVYKCLDFMSMYEARYEAAGRLRDVLHAIISASPIPSLSDQLSLKRPRSLDDSSEQESIGIAARSPPVRDALGIQTSSKPHARPYAQEFHAASATVEGDHSMGLESQSEYTSDATQWEVDSHDANAVPSDFSQGDWDSFMGVVDQLLQAVHPAGGYQSAGMGSSDM